MCKKGKEKVPQKRQKRPEKTSPGTKKGRQSSSGGSIGPKKTLHLRPQGLRRSDANMLIKHILKISFLYLI